VNVIRSYLIDILDGPKHTKVPSGSRAKALLQGACEITSNHLKIKKNCLLPLFLTFLFWFGSLCIVHSVIAQDEYAHEVVVDLDEINIFDDQENELLGPEWQEIELKLVKLQEAFKLITQIEADENASNILDEQTTEQIEEQTEEQTEEQPEAVSQKIESDNTEWQKTDLKLAILQETIKEITSIEADESASSVLDEQRAEQPETESQKIEAQETEYQKAEPDETQPQEAEPDEAQPKEAEPDETQPQDAVDDGSQGEGEKVSETVELNGDIVEYSIDGNKITAQGNVVVINKDMDLTCDRIEFSRDTNMAYATGNVRLVMKKGDSSEMVGEKLTFNFKTMEGSFDGAKIYAKPYYGYGKKVFKVGENHMRMEDDYITTCDLDKPHYRLASKKMDIYPGEKLVARSIRMLIGNLPMLYLPKMTQEEVKSH